VKNSNANDPNSAKSTANLIFLIKLLEHAQETISRELLNHFRDDDIRDTSYLLEASQHIGKALEVLCRRK
jgi:hypothetical protein